MDAVSIIDEVYKNEPELKNILLKHSSKVCEKALTVLRNSRIELDENEVICGALLHDIGIRFCHAPSIMCYGNANYMAHGIIGADFLREYGRRNNMDMEVYARIAERHTGSGLTAEDIKNGSLPLPLRDFLPETPLEKLICLADKFFSKSGDMEEKSFASVRRSMAEFGAGPLQRFDELAEMFDLN